MKTMRTMMAVAALALATGCEMTTPGPLGTAAAKRQFVADADRLIADREAHRADLEKWETYQIHHGYHWEQTGNDFQTDECGRLQVYPHYELEHD